MIPTAEDHKAKTVAMALAAAYWRGRIHPLLDHSEQSEGMQKKDAEVVRQMMKAAAETDWAEWMEPARDVLLACYQGVER